MGARRGGPASIARFVLLLHVVEQVAAPRSPASGTSATIDGDTESDSLLGGVLPDGVEADGTYEPLCDNGLGFVWVTGSNRSPGAFGGDIGYRNTIRRFHYRESNRTQSW